MKKTLVALAALAATSAFAQSSVTMYGTIDASIASVSSAGSSDGNNPGNINGLNSYASAGANQTTAPTTSGKLLSMGSGLMSGSRWGIKGSEDLGSGMKASFIMEGALNAAAGTSPNDHALLAAKDANVTGAGDSAANGQLFSREMSVGLSGNFGAVKAGFLSSSQVHANAMVDPFALGGISPVGFYSSWGGGGSSDTRMATNAVQWNYNFANGSMVEGFYAMGGNSGNVNQGRQLGMLGKLQVNSELYLVGALHEMNDNVAYGSSPTAIYSAPTSPATAGTLAGYAPGLSASYFNSKSATLGASWQAASNLNVKGGYINIIQSTASNLSGDASVQQNLGIQVNTINQDVYNTNAQRHIAFAGGTYDLSGADHVMAAYYTATLKGFNRTRGTTTTDYAANGYKVINVAYVHDFSKRTNVYAVYQTMSESSDGTTNQFAGANDGQKQHTVAFGVRHSF